MDDTSFKNDQSFAELTTLQIGGPIQKFIEATSEDLLISAIEFAKKQSLPYLVIGGGSNLLVSDEGFSGVVIKNSIIGIDYANDLLTVKAGTPLQQLVDFAIEKGISGFQKMTGIPGTVGGAVYGNAGAYGQGISDLLAEVKVFNGQEITTLFKADCHFGYRDSYFKVDKKLIILEVTFNQLTTEDSQKLKDEANETLTKRLIKYPPGLKTPGSFFKNLLSSNLSPDALAKIPNDKIMYGKIPAGYLLEEVGAKGDKFGQIQISPNHGNTFINLGEGKAEEFAVLAKKYAKKVKEKFGINLEPEVQFVNLPPLFS